MPAGTVRALITGLSGVGKSSVLGELAARGFRVADTDYDGLSRADATGDWLWDLDRLRHLLDAPDQVVVVSGTARNMGELLPRFDRVVLLSAPTEVMLHRLATRTNNPYGSTSQERTDAVAYKQTVEPLLRRIATIEIDTSSPLDEVVAAVVDHVMAWTAESRAYGLGADRRSRCDDTDPNPGDCAEVGTFVPVLPTQ